MVPSPRVTEILLDVWKEVGRHDQIEDSLERLYARLARALPIAGARIRRFDAAEARLETVAAAGVDAALDGVAARTALAGDDVLRFTDWARRERSSAWRRGEQHPLRALVDPAGADAPALAGPLCDRGRPVGVLLLRGAGDALASASEIVDALLEPFAVALSNELRLLELARLREAAEADKRALLTRLQREDISDSVVGERTGLRNVMERVEQVARTDAPVLILGETGSGKEVVARAIHARSRRAKGPFLRVNCGAIPAELVDSELFGHEKGSFTGAVNSRRGWFERADGGTLFLDELAELQAAAQVRLLRVLQDGTFERVGGQKTLHVDVRIVAATHRDMPAQVAAQAFREDLWYRINVFPIALPPLRERREDIGALAAHFAARAGRRLHGVELTLGARDVELLSAYDWPGNVRELASVIERATILGEGRALAVEAALGVDPRKSREAGAPRAAPQRAPEPTLDAAIVDRIVAALRRTRGQVEGAHGAARILGVNPHTLRSRMRKLGIDWASFRGA